MSFFHAEIRKNTKKWDMIHCI